MGHFHSCNNRGLAWIGIFAVVVPFSFLCDSALALTASVGQPYRGRLVNGVPFPTQFRGYQIRPQDRTHTSPEVIGAVLDAIDAVQKQHPSTCDLYLGDFSAPGGGFLNHHRSHQNGRDVDIGMYFKGNRMVDTFKPMNEANLDVPKTWCFVESLLRTQRIQYIFLDRKVQKLLYDYALSRGVDETYLNRLFGNSKGAIVQHVVNHQDHMHVRFYTPWSTLAARVGEMEAEKRTVIEMAQQAYLPKKVNYYVQGTEHNLDALAQSFGVNRRDLCRWNNMSPSEVMTPGSCLVFFKRGFELEPVHVAQSLRADWVPSYRLASYRPSRTMSDVSMSLRTPLKDLEPSVENKAAPPEVRTHVVKKGDTLPKIAKESGIEVGVLREMNNMKPKGSLLLGQKLRVPAGKTATRTMDPRASTVQLQVAPPRGLASARTQEQASPGLTHTVGRGETVRSISKRYGVKMGDLCRNNGISKGTVLKPGQKVVITRADDSPKTDSRATQPKSVSSPSQSKAGFRQSARSASSASSKPAKRPTSANKGSSRMKASTTKAVSSQAKTKSAAGVKKASTSDKSAAVDKPVRQKSTKIAKEPQKSAKLDVRKRAN